MGMAAGHLGIAMCEQQAINTMAAVSAQPPCLAHTVLLSPVLSPPTGPPVQ